MTLVLAALGFAMLGLFLPLTIYYQSVLGLTAVGAGLTIAAQPLAMMVSSGLASGLIGKVGAKTLLIPGLTLFAAGMAFIDWTAQADSSRWGFLPGLIAAGIGLGFVWTPVFSVATRDLKPHLAGVASGVLNTMQEMGGVIASAAVGAVLQARLATALQTRAASAASSLPPAARRPFVDTFKHAGSAGFDVGRGQTGGTVHLPQGLPPAVSRHIADAAASVFRHGFVDAMHPTLVLPLAVVVLAALGSFGVVHASPSRADEDEAQRKQPALERSIS
jgi:hypothetical protein